MTLEPNIKNRYFTGKPCSNGHIAERLISNKVCVQCAKIRKLKWAFDNQNKLNERAQTRRKENPEKFKAYDNLRYHNDPKPNMLSAAKQRAKNKGLWFNLDLTDIIIPKLCPLLNIPLIITRGGISDNSPTLDRIKNDRGYMKGNIIVISHLANRCKQNLTSSDIFKLACNLKILEDSCTMPEWLALEKGFI